jgi:hypothetical protein
MDCDGVELSGQAIGSKYPLRTRLMLVGSSHVVHVQPLSKLGRKTGSSGGATKADFGQIMAGAGRERYV